MYNQGEVKLLESPESKYKELTLRLKDSEKERFELKREQTKMI